jgi:hypothetical protein
MPLFEIEFCYTQSSHGIATIKAQTLVQAEAMAGDYVVVVAIWI